MNASDIRRVLVVGAGSMGHGLAQVYALSGFTVDLADSSPAALARAQTLMAASFRNLAAIGRVTPEEGQAAARRIAPVGDLAAAAARADMVLEAVTEDGAVKAELFAELDRHLRPGVLLASNTSGLDVFTLLADVIPQRLGELVILHYFLPPLVVPLVEVVRGPATAPATLTAARTLVDWTGHVPVVLERFVPHFIVNNFQIALAGVAARLLAEGVASPEDIDRAVKCSLGVRLPVVGVVQTLDFTGLDLVARMLRHAGQDASFFEHLAAQGRRGVKDGHGLYDYAGRTPEEVTARRDALYWAHYQHLRRIGAFDPV